VEVNKPKVDAVSGELGMRPTSRLEVL
jgi:hypothetical protein